MSHTGKFVISLDFELMWGVRDCKTIESYGPNILGVHKVIPRLLSLFQQYQIAATFSTVGFLFLKNMDELLANLPASFPGYQNKNLSPFNGYIDNLGEDELTNNYHFAPDLIQQIKESGLHEIGSHTYSHYYCLEPGQNIANFKDDLRMAKTVAAEHKITLQSLVFPRNQYNHEYLAACKEAGIICIRGNKESWLYNARSNESLLLRAVRLADSYIPLAGLNTFAFDELEITEGVINIPASRFLRPAAAKPGLVHQLHLNRIMAEMTYAAKH
ncbi:MAG: hypothetical protein EOP49_27585, partial [Sphingobacteriales bacterium]